jgi:hypothetical protein
MTKLWKASLLTLALAISTMPATTSVPRPTVAAPAPQTTNATTTSSALGSGTLIVAKLLTTINAAKCKAGDRVEAQITRSVSQNHKEVWKPGAIISGRITGVNVSSDDKPHSNIEILLDDISNKNGDPTRVLLAIRALAVEAQLQHEDDIRRGGAVDEMRVASAGGYVAGPLPGGVLGPENSGVFGLPGLRLDQMVSDKGVQVSVVVSEDRNFHLPKGTQMILQVIGD